LNDKIETPKRGVFLFGLALLKFNADVCTLLIFAASARLLREKRVKGDPAGEWRKNETSTRSINASRHEYAKRSSRFFL
jgi:hypothetical protein